MNNGATPVLTVVTALTADDPNIHETAESIRPVLGNDLHWIIKQSGAQVRDDMHGWLDHPCVSVIVQPDASLYDALNQALDHVRSPWFQVLGAGDRLTGPTVPSVLNTIRRMTGFDLVFYATRLSATGTVLRPRPTEMPVRMACPHPSAIMRAEAARLAGGFDAGYRIAADYDLMSRCLRRHGESAWSDDVLVDFKGGGMSEQRAWEGVLEEELIRRRVWSASWPTIRSRLLRRILREEQTAPAAPKPVTD